MNRAAFPSLLVIAAALAACGAAKNDARTVQTTLAAPAPLG
jgi:hypothetical protein